MLVNIRLLSQKKSYNNVMQYNFRCPSASKLVGNLNYFAFLNYE